MKRKELEEFKKRWEENLGGLGEMLKVFVIYKRKL